MQVRKLSSFMRKYLKETSARTGGRSCFVGSLNLTEKDSGPEESDMHTIKLRDEIHTNEAGENMDVKSHFRGSVCRLCVSLHLMLQ